eukprot:scaffold227995_cov35-Tisochrysis_lutea.AAC.1
MAWPQSGGEQSRKVDRDTQDVPCIIEEGLCAYGRRSREVEPPRVPIQHDQALLLAWPSQLNCIAKQAWHLLAGLAPQIAHTNGPLRCLASHSLVVRRPVLLALVARLRAHFVSLMCQIDNELGLDLPDHRPEVGERGALGAHCRDEAWHVLAQVVDWRSVDVFNGLERQQRVGVRAHLATKAVELTHDGLFVRPAPRQLVVF